MPAAADLDSLQQAYAAAMRHDRLLPAQGRLIWTWRDGAARPGVWPMARSAVELATAGPLELVNQCPAPEGCGWLFLDTTKNRIRRWCSMDECGGQAKARGTAKSLPKPGRFNLPCAGRRGAGGVGDRR
jgi:predicted RNA-binding Zn ribbon-like protein